MGEEELTEKELREDLDYVITENLDQLAKTEPLEWRKEYLEDLGGAVERLLKYTFAKIDALEKEIDRLKSSENGRERDE